MCVPLKESPYFNLDILHELEGDIAKLSEDGYIMLAGDFNAKTGCLLDFIDRDNCHHIPGDNIPSHFDFKRRKNFDNDINEHGNVLLRVDTCICKTCELRILNSRTKSVSFGKITFNSPQGISTVDYIIASQEMLNVIESFVVKPPSIFSDHSQIMCWIKCSSSDLPQPQSKHSMFPLPKQYRGI